jgi:GDP-L-fucose synthase
MNWWEKRFLVTGGAGFLGSHVVGQLKASGAERVFVPRRKDFDLRKRRDAFALINRTDPDVIIHLAANVGGIGANRERPAEFFYDNLMMGVNLIDEAKAARVGKFVTVGTVCAYPKYTPIPFREEELWNGYPEETNAPYGIAKKALLVMGQAYRQQYGFNAVYVLPTNLYGPRDNFDPRSSHVIPALIRKCLEAKEQGADYIDVWGTGSASRDFLYVEDAARGIVQIAAHYDSPEPMNLGSGHEITIRELVGLIAAVTGFEGELRWDTSKPDGQPRRRLDITRAREAIGFEPQVPFEMGLRQTVEWFMETHYAGMMEVA